MPEAQATEDLCTEQLLAKYRTQWEYRKKTMMCSLRISPKIEALNVYGYKVEMQKV